MSNIIEDVFEDVEIKPNKSKIIIKWIIRISLVLIGAAFIFGQIKVNYLNKFDKFEENINNNSVEIKNLKEEMNIRFDKVYLDGLEAFIEYNNYNKKQLELIIDYNKTDKTFLKKMLELNSIEKTENVKNKLKR